MHDLDNYKGSTLQSIADSKRDFPDDKEQIAWAHSIIVLQGSEYMNRLQ